VEKKKLISQSSTCIPNLSPLQILAPIVNPDICPLWSERWEVRTRGLGCHVSTITLLTCVVSVVSTCAVIGLAVGAFYFGRWVRKKWKGRGDGWWRFWRWGVWRGEWARGWRVRLVDKTGRNDEERRPLLVPEG
jgi:hypothetical protein